MKSIKKVDKRKAEVKGILSLEERCLAYLAKPNKKPKLRNMNELAKQKETTNFVGNIMLKKAITKKRIAITQQIANAAYLCTVERPIVSHQGL